MSRMGSSRLWWETTVLVAVCGWCLAAQAKYGGGTGEPNNPYGMATPQDLNDISIIQSTDIGPLYDDVPPVHGWIALQAYNKLASALKTEIGLYLPTSSSSWYYSSTFSAPSGWSNDPDAHYSDSEALIEGAWEEDNPWTRSLEHYWRPDGGYDDGLYLDRSALQKAQEDLWQQAIDAYNSGNKARGYYLLGRVAHLLMDMSVPAHTLLDEHFPDSYETFTENNYTEITSSSPNTAIPSDLPDYPMTTPPSYNSSVTKLFYDVAEKSDDFDSDDEDGESSDYGKGKYTWGRNALNASKTLFQAQYWRWDIIDGWKYLYDLDQNVDYDDFRSCVSASEYHIYYYKSFYDEYNNAFDYRVKVVYTDATSEFVNSNIDEFGDVPDSVLECIHQKQLQSRAIGYVAALYQLFWDSTDHPDTTPPTPNPLTWNTEPYETSTSSISMTATAATDSSTPIYYQFELSGSPTGGSGRDWDTSRVYTDSSLEANHQYGYRVRARDSAPAQNTTGWSSVSYDYTDIETPSGATFGTITSTSIQVKSSNTPSGLTRGSSGLYIDSSYGTNSGWKQNNDFWTCSNLIPNYDCSFHIKARNGDGDETGYYASIWKYTLANQPGTAPFSNITTNSIQAKWTSNGNYYYTDYFGENVTTGQNSGWVNDTYSWNNTGLSSGTNYSFKVKARNSDGIETEWTDLGSISTYTPSIAINKPSIDMELFAQDVTFDIWNDGAGTLGYDVSISEGDTYFSVSPSSGTSTGSSDKKTHTIHVNRDNILPGQTVTGKVMITASEANDSPQYIDLSASKIEFTLSGSGTESDPYLIYTPEQLNTIGLYPDKFDKHYKLMADIDLSLFTGTEFNVIGNQFDPFTGVFDGNEYVISNLTRTSGGSCYIGLFGYIEYGGIIKNLLVVNINVNAGSGILCGAGGIAGYNSGTVSNCHTTGSLSGQYCCGGLIGKNHGVVNHCSSSVSVFVLRWDRDCTMGGLLGANEGAVYNCYANGSVTGTVFQIGGLIGGNDGIVRHCYAAGMVSGGWGVGGLIGGSSDLSDLVQDSYWDTESSTQLTSCGGEGKTTVQMKQMSTFTNWDFVRAWGIQEGTSYPSLTGLLEEPVKYIDDDTPDDPAPGDPNISDPLENGSIDHPFDSIQEGIDAANPGDTVIVKLGTYTGNGNRDLTFNHKGITLTSINPDDFNVVNSTVINSGGTVTEEHRAFCIVGWSVPDRILIQGLTISGGYASEGGGIYSFSNVQIADCVFRDNIANYGGAVYFGTGWTERPGVGCCRRCGGEPIYYWMLPSFISRCTITNNTANYGGGIYGPAELFDKNLIVHNTADYGGGVYCWGASIFNNTIVQNSAVYGGGIYNVGTTDGTINNSILWGNTASEGGQIALVASTIGCNYSNIEGGAAEIYVDPNSTLNWGLGNIDTDPLFVESGYWDPNSTPTDPNDDFWVNGDYHLLPDSPCIDTGDPNYPEDANEFDIDGDTRIIGGRIDMGADEYAFGELSDFSGNGIVSFEDFAVLAEYWMDYVCAEPDWCEGCDFDHSGLVDLNDLRKFAENWLWQAAWYGE